MRVIKHYAIKTNLYMASTFHANKMNIGGKPPTVKTQYANDMTSPRESSTVPDSLGLVISFAYCGLTVGWFASSHLICMKCRSHVQYVVCSV